MSFSDFERFWPPRSLARFIGSAPPPAPLHSPPPPAPAAAPPPPLQSSPAAESPPPRTAELRASWLGLRRRRSCCFVNFLVGMGKCCGSWVVCGVVGAVDLWVSGFCLGFLASRLMRSCSFCWDFLWLFFFCECWVALLMLTDYHFLFFFLPAVYWFCLAAGWFLKLFCESGDLFSVLMPWFWLVAVCFRSCFVEVGIFFRFYWTMPLKTSVFVLI